MFCRKRKIARKSIYISTRRHRASIITVVKEVRSPTVSSGAGVCEVTEVSRQGQRETS